MTGTARVILLTRHGCQLCGPARETVTEVCGSAGVRWAEVDVDTDSELRGEYGDRVPVVLVDGHEHAELLVERDALAAAISG